MSEDYFRKKNRGVSMSEMISGRSRQPRIDDYFRAEDAKLVDDDAAMRRTRRAGSAPKRRVERRHRTTSRSRWRGPGCIAELEALGFTPDTISVLPLVPIVEMLGRGRHHAAERTMLVTLARTAGLRKAAPPIDSSDWLSRPSADVFARATRLIRAMLDTGSAEGGTLSADELIKYSESIAAASGGILGIGKISAEERETLAKIVAALKAR